MNLPVATTSPVSGKPWHKVLLLAISVALSLIAIELLLRAFWKNPARYTVVGLDWSGYLRLQNVGINANYYISGLYETAQRARFRTGPDSAIITRHPASSNITAHFYGGSTTECRYVDEGRRWPELVHSLAGRNYGVSGNNLLDNYFNFQFHTHNPATCPRVAVFMDAVNDWSARNVFTPELYLANYERAWGRDRRSNLPQDRSGWYIGDLLELLRRNLATRVSVTELYRAAARDQNARPLPPLPDDEFEHVLVDMQRDFLTNRAALIGRIARLSRERGVRLVVITQPNAYREDYVPWSGEDHRLYPDWENRRMSARQADRLMEAINENTRKAAREHDVELIDVAASFRAQQPGPLFYDSVHLTAAGCELFGRLVEEHFTLAARPPG
jgi:hypothetical protein